MTLPLSHPYLTGADDINGTAPPRAVEVQDNFDDIAKAIDPARLNTHAGAATITWDGVNNLATLTVNHGFANAPVDARLAGQGAHYLNWLVTSITSTQVTFQVSNDGATPPAGSENVSWMAVG